MSKIIWCEAFVKIISNCSEARGFMSGHWWNICEFELDCGIIKLDVMGKTQVNYLEDFEYLDVDGVVYEMEKILGDELL